MIADLHCSHNAVIAETTSLLPGSFQDDANTTRPPAKASESVYVNKRGRAVAEPHAFP